MSASRVYILTLLLVAAQGLLAWHSPSHLVTTDAHDGPQVLQVSDCELCTFGQGLATTPALLPVTPTPGTRTTVSAPVSGYNPPTIAGAGARAPPVLS